VTDGPMLSAFRQGFSETGFVEGRNVAIEFRWAEGRYERLPELVHNLVRRKVAVIVTSGGEASAQAPKAATSTIPIVFNTGGDPVEAGLVASFSRPKGNLTGVSSVSTMLMPKQFGRHVLTLDNACVVQTSTDHGTRETNSSFNDLVGAGEHALRNIKPEQLRGPEIDHQLEAGRLHDRELGRLFALQDATGIDAHLAIALRRARPVADEAPGIDHLATEVHGGECMTGGKGDEPIHPCDEQGARRDEQCLHAPLNQSLERDVDVDVGTGLEDDGLAADRMSSRHDLRNTALGHRSQGLRTYEHPYQDRFRRQFAQQASSGL
jgi:ABC transporter substrate binding protein